MSEQRATYSSSSSNEQVVKAIGCTTITTTLTPDYEITESSHRLFAGWPTIIKKSHFPYQKEKQWYVTHMGGGYPLDLEAPEYAVDLNRTHRLFVFLEDDYLPPRIFKTLLALVGMQEREIHLIRSGAFTLNQTPIIQTIYTLTPVKPGDWTYITFEPVDDSAVDVHIHREPEWVTVEETQKFLLSAVSDFALDRHSTLTASDVEQWNLSPEDYAKLEWNQGYLVVSVEDVTVQDVRVEDGVQIWYVAVTINVGLGESNADVYSAYLGQNGEWIVEWDHS
jgi:hypothetical protein